MVRLPRHRRLQRCIALISVLLPLPMLAESHAIWLEVSGTNLHVNVGEVAVLPSASVPLLQVHLHRQPNEVSYSRITTWVNAASANIVTTQRATDEGIICSLDLARNPGLALHPGRNSVEVTFKDLWNESHYASFILQIPLDKAHAVPAPSTAAPYRGEHRFAVVIGIAKYKNGGRGIENIPYADQDAAAFKAEMISPRGGNVPEENTRLLLNEDATQENIEKALQWVSREARPEDVVVVYLNLNGAFDPQNPDNKYLLSYDSDPAEMALTAISVSSLPSLIANPDGSKHVVVLGDTCHGNATNVAAPEKLSVPNLVNLYLARAFSQEGQSALEASDIHQISRAGPEWGDRGVFTHFLIEGIQGAADTNHDGSVTTLELFRYVQMKVSAATMDAQLPIIAPGHASDVALSGIATARRAH